MTLPLVVALVVLALLAGAVVRATAAPTVGRLLLVVVAAAAWLPADKPVEGLTLVSLGHDHGITSSDLLSLAAVALAGLSLALGRRSRDRGDDRRPTRTGW